MPCSTDRRIARGLHALVRGARLGAARASARIAAIARAGRSALLIAPTGAGKTLAGFLPTLVELSATSPRAPSAPSPREGGEGRGGGSKLSRITGPPTPDPSPPLAPLMGGGEKKRLISTGRGIRRAGGLHTLYISPLKALAVDIARNLERPVAEMDAADPHRDAHRRHAGLEAPAPAPRSARHPAHHAGAARAAARLRRRAVPVRLAPARRSSTSCIRW